MSLLDIDKARADYTEWVNGTDDPPTLGEEAARLLSHRITGHHFPNLLAAYVSSRAEVERLRAQRDEALAIAEQGWSYYSSHDENDLTIASNALRDLVRVLSRTECGTND